MQGTYNPIVLCILDGFGIGSHNKYNAITNAKTSCLDFLANNFPHTELLTSGQAVGLPEGQMGNSEVGHMTIGSGRVIFQDLVRINNEITNDNLANYPQLQKLIIDHKNNHKAVHLLGLCSDGGVHSHINHLLYLAELLAKNNINVELHLFLDGRDVGYNTAASYLAQIDQLIAQYKSIRIASIMGRFYAMDRDNRWERVELAYKAIVLGDGKRIASWQECLEEQYNSQLYDEFVSPAVLGDYDGIGNDDSILFFNFRSDRVRQLAQSLLLENFDKFFRLPIQFKHMIGMTRYSDELDKILTTLFPEQKLKNNLAEVISRAGKKQLRIAETEKYAHVTFFFNCGVEEPYAGEERILIPSPKVDTYDLEPEMSAHAVTNQLVEAIDSKKYNLIIVNYANCDMVGHSGKLEAAVKAVEVIDQSLERVYQAIAKTNGILLITADHGNVEMMFDNKAKTMHTSHTTNPVPLFFIANNLKQKKLPLAKGSLSDIAPTILKLMNIDKPKEMIGSSIL